MAPQSHEFKAKSVDEAIHEGLKALNVSRDEVEIEVINKGSRGLFGIGSEPAVVHIRLQEAASEDRTPEPASSTADAAESDDPLPSTVAEEPTPSEKSAASSPSDNTAVHVEPATAIREEDAEQSDTGKSDTDKSDTGESDTDEDALADAADEQDVADGETDEVATELLLDGSESEEEEELAALAADMLDEMIHLMDFDAQITAQWKDDEDEFDDEERDRSRSRYLLLDVEGTELGALIGRRGETLDNIQYLLRLMVNQKIHQWKNIVVDVEHYKERRIQQVTQLAERMAEQVARTGKAISLEPMPPNERRIVHMVLRSYPGVYTESYGEGARRKVHIFVAD